MPDLAKCVVHLTRICVNVNAHGIGVINQGDDVLVSGVNGVAEASGKRG